ncbi:putative transcriptional regulator [Mucilaginibacter rubeus]|uniref:helix-turn-helix domain-containing protein n=1 Tax=Mucilaginibacter rubeus TaxID=2027860 RepID=UPI0033931091
MAKETLTRLGLYLAKKAVNKAMLSKLTGISTFRLSQLSINPKSHLRVKELYLIALAIEVNPAELLDFVSDGVELPVNKLN